MQISRLCLAASLAAITSVGPAFAAEDVGAGQEIYQAQCSACHSNQPGVNGIGPSLAGVAGRKAGSLQGFHYTPAISGSGLTWDAKTFIQFLADPTKLVPGTAMTVMVPDETGRANLFAYLATLKDTTAETKPSGPAGAQDHRSHAGRSRRRRAPRPTPGFTPRTIMPGRVSSISIRSRRKTPRTCVPSASTAPSNRPRCRRARSSMAG